ncbi:MAG: histidine phosphatase family protein [Paracoccaceae bacterium]|nr:histidine phosphatase family protein [Paracoccaceae bacterium]
MGEIMLVRHGQANTGATDEASYDKLSALGHTQAKWLGAYLDDHDMKFDRVVNGTLRRHKETRSGMGLSACAEDARLNEMQYFPMAEALERNTGIPVPKDPPSFASHVPITLQAWKDDKLSGIPERYSSFENRIWDVMQEALASDKRIVFVTSGGVISVVMARILGLDVPAMASMLLQIRNSSYHRISRFGGQLHMHQFNATPHLAHPERAHALTFV